MKQAIATKEVKRRFSFTNFARLVIKRQIVKKTDTFVIIYGLPRTGKTTLGFKILFPFLRLKREMYRKGLSDWKVEHYWKKLFDKYFATSCEDMSRKLKFNPAGSFDFIDEGLDIVSWHTRLTTEQKDLLELIQKTGKRVHLTILLTPSVSLLTKEILARAHYMFIIPTEPLPEGNRAFLFKNYTVPFLAEKFPFGLKRIEKDLEKHPFLASDKSRFLRYLTDRRRFITTIKFGPIQQKLYDLYDKLVKEPSIMRERKKRRMVSSFRYNKLKYLFDTLLYNLYTKDDKSVAKLVRLMTDKFGYGLTNATVIRAHLDRIRMMEVRPKMKDVEEVLEAPKEEISPEEDIEVEATLASEV